MRNKLIPVALVTVLLCMALTGSISCSTQPPTAPPSAPVLNAPANSATEVSITPRLEWHESSGATTYGLQLSTTPDFATLLVDHTGITSPYYDIPSALSYGTAYYWRANASNAHGTSDWSSPWTFTTEVASSSAAEELSARIVAVDIDETTALTSLFRISDEISQAQTDGSLYEGEEAELQAELMKQFTDWVDTREERLGLNSLPPAPTGNITWSEEDSALLEGANERIEQYRHGDATILVVDADGAPVANAEVRLDMLKHDFLFGSWAQLTYSEFFAPSPAYRDALARLFNYVTIPNFWSLYEPVQGQVSQEYLLEDLINKTRWAKDRGMTVEGHNLIYIALPYSFFPLGPPEWVQQLSPGEVDDVLHGHVTSLVTTFSGLVDYWVALNEPTNTEPMEEPLRSWMMSNTPAGAEALTLEWAHAADPKVKLIINDWEFFPEEFHQVLEDVVAAGAPFDVIGFETYMCEGRWTLGRIWEVFELLKDFNKPLQLTELEVHSGDPQDPAPTPLTTTPEGEAIQAEYLSAFYTVLFSHPSAQAITYTWFSDLTVPMGEPGGLLRKDMSPKPAYEQLMRLIHQDWWTNAEATTDAQGEATIRGFYGRYLLTVTSGTQTVQTLVHLEAGQDNIFEVQLP